MRIAVCEAGEIQPDQDAGSRAIADLVDGYRELGHNVELFAEIDQDLVQRVEAFGPSVAVVSRPGLFARVQPALALLEVPLVYLAHDLHFVRVGLQGHFMGDRTGAAEVMRLVEKRCFESADLVLVPTVEEKLRAIEEFPRARIVAIDYFAFPVQSLPDGPPREPRLVFVGGAAHAPNRDGVGWFLGEVWPRVLTDFPDSTLDIVGTWGDAAAPFVAVEGVRFRGRIPDTELEELLAAAWAGIAPLRFGAGMKRKTLHYLSHGLPVVGTRYAVEGLTDESGHVPGVIRADDAEGWMAALRELRDARRWTALSATGAGFVRERFSPERYRRGLATALEAVL